MKKQYQIMRINKKEEIVPDGFDYKSIHIYSFNTDEYGWIFDTEKEAEEQIEHLLSLNEYEWNSFTILPVYSKGSNALY